MYAGVLYDEILALAEKDADVIVWDGGNNDTSYVVPDLLVCVADPLRGKQHVSEHVSVTYVYLSMCA